MRIYFTLFLFILYASAPQINWAQNLVANGSFSNNGTSWTFFPPATDIEAYYPETSYGGVDGTNIVAEIDNQCNLKQSNIPVSPGQEYWFSFRHSRRTGNGAAPNPVSIRVKLFDANNVYVDTQIVSSNAQWQWQCKIFRFTPAGSMVNVELANATAPSTLGTIVDDITITPVEQIIEQSGILCEGGSVVLSGPSSNPDNRYSDYAWTGPNGFSDTGREITVDQLTPDHSGSYICEMQLNYCLVVKGAFNLTVAKNNFSIDTSICAGDNYDFYGRLLEKPGVYDTIIRARGSDCDSFITLKLQVIDLAQPAMLPAVAEQEMCEGDTLLLRVLSPEENTVYTWLKDGRADESGTIAYAVYESGHYQLLRQGRCPDTSAPLEVKVHPNPDARIREPRKKICIQDTVTLRAAQADQRNNYQWLPLRIFWGEGSGRGPEVTGKFGEKRTQVILTVGNEWNCYSADTLYIETQKCNEVFVPSAFSPNGDGMNDVFRIHVKNEKILSFKIFNRYGNLLFQGDTRNREWDGTHNGKPAAAGVYFYDLRVELTDGEVERYSGDITLVR